VTIGQKVLFAGGNNNDHPSSDVVDIYDAATNTMLAPTQLSIPRNWPAATAVGKYALIAGGGHFVNPTTVEWSDVVDIWNSETGEWSTSSLSLPRAFMTAGTIGNRAYFAGGGEVDLSIGFYNTSTARVDIFDSSTGLWSTDEMPSARTTCYGTVSCNQLFVPGGWYPEGPQILSDVLIYTDSSFSCISGVQDIFGENLLVAPNPVREELQLINLDTDIFDRFEIFNLAGHSMHQQNTQPQSGKINVADLPAGFYLLRLSTRTGHTVNRTFVKA
jgi:hypothetical protein